MFWDACHRCHLVQKENVCFIYEQGLKLCLHCYVSEHRVKKKMIEAMQDIPEINPLLDYAYYPDLARIDERWDGPLFYSYLNH
jgi:pyruvate formate-lyase activating enzyme-like uncharacterized protein